MTRMAICLRSANTGRPKEGAFLFFIQGHLKELKPIPLPVHFARFHWDTRQISAMSLVVFMVVFTWFYIALGLFFCDFKSSIAFLMPSSGAVASIPKRFSNLLLSKK